MILTLDDALNELIDYKIHVQWSVCQVHPVGKMEVQNVKWKSRLSGHNL